MRPTSVYCHRVDARGRRPHRRVAKPADESSQRRQSSSGFTLLELLVVLALAGLLIGVTAPRLLGWIDAAQSRAVTSEARTILQSLPTRAFLSGTVLVIEQTTGTDALLQLPTGWRAELPTAVRYEANGMTPGGRLRLWQGDTLRADWSIGAPTGVVTETRTQL